MTTVIIFTISAILCRPALPPGGDRQQRGIHVSAEPCTRPL